MRLFSVFALGCAVACTHSTDKGDSGGDDSGGSSGTGAPTFSDFINVTDAPIGDFSGFEGGYEGNGSAWLSQTVDPSLQVEVPMSGIVKDFDSGHGVPDATLSIWYSDHASGASDVYVISDADGAVSGKAMTCQPQTYLTSTDPELEETKNTYEAHQVYAYGDHVTDEFNSVSSSTYAIIPSLLGVKVDADKGVVAGTAYDSNGDPITGAQVIVTDADDNIPDSLSVHYFVDSWPTRDQPYTSADGLWVAINVPEGSWNVTMYVSDGAGGFLEMGRTTIEVVADSINISNIYTGYGDGVKYPANCLAE